MSDRIKKLMSRVDAGKSKRVVASTPTATDHQADALGYALDTAPLTVTREFKRDGLWLALSLTAKGNADVFLERDEVIAKYEMVLGACVARITQMKPGEDDIKTWALDLIGLELAGPLEIHQEHPTMRGAMFKVQVKILEMPDYD